MVDIGGPSTSTIFGGSTMDELREKNEVAISLAGLGAAFLLLAGVVWTSTEIGATVPAGVSSARNAANIGADLNALPATGAGVREAPRLEEVLGGKRLTGRVRNRFVRVGNDVYPSAKQVPEIVNISDVAYFVEVEFPERLPNGKEFASAQLVNISGVQIGDIVEVRIAHKHNPRFFPVREVTRVTELVARSDTAFARDFGSKIGQARQGGSALQAMLPTGPQSAYRR